MATSGGSKRRLRDSIANVVIAIFILDFLAMLLLRTAFGDRSLGYAAGGRFYLWDHGHYNEVSKTIWDISGLLNDLLPPLLLAFFIGFAVRFVPLVSAGLSRRTDPAAAAIDSDTVDRRVQFVRSSGPVLASNRLSGAIANVGYAGPLIHVAVHPAGVVLKPILARPRPVLTEEIVSIKSGKEYGREHFSIDHNAQGTGSPVLLYESPDAPVGAAIRSLVNIRNGLAPILPTRKPARQLWFLLGSISVSKPPRK